MRDSTGGATFPTRHAERGMQPFEGRLGTIGLEGPFRPSLRKTLSRGQLPPTYREYLTGSVDLWPFDPAMKALASSMLGGWATPH